jgi:hypothetical protein
MTLINFTAWIGVAVDGWLNCLAVFFSCGGHAGIVNCFLLVLESGLGMAVDICGQFIYYPCTNPNPF